MESIPGYVVIFLWLALFLSVIAGILLFKKKILSRRKISGSSDSSTPQHDDKSNGDTLAADSMPDPPDKDGSA